MKKLFCFLILLFFFGFFKPDSSFAEKIDSFDVSIVAHEDGLMKIEEIIRYDFESLDRHGIYRYIPIYSRVGDLYRIIKLDGVFVERNGKAEKFETNINKEQIYFKIGDPDKTITGKQTYKIIYTVENGVGSNFSTHDEIYWNGTGNSWTVPIYKASINFGNDFEVKPQEIKCFIGEFGSTNSQCKIEGNKIVYTGVLNPGEGLTGVVKYPKGTFPPSTLLKELPKTFTDILFEFVTNNYFLIWTIINILVAPVLFKHILFKKRSIFNKPSVNFEIPKDENGKRIFPALAGIIDNAKLEKDDVVATIFDLAIRKHIKIEQVKRVKKLMPDLVDQKIIKLKGSEGLNQFEKLLFERLFKEGNEVFVKDLKKDFYDTYSEMEDESFKILINEKYYRFNPVGVRAILTFIGLIALFTGNIIFAIGVFLSIKSALGRTSLGNKIDLKIDGLKLFLKSMDRNYKWQAKNFLTVEQMIPYAISLGYIDKFMEQLKIIKPDYNPTWYAGYRGSFYASYAGFYSSMSSNVTTSAPSSSSGFSGGSSGGGGGGGGGGSW